MLIFLKEMYTFLASPRADDSVWACWVAKNPAVVLQLPQLGVFAVKPGVERRVVRMVIYERTFGAESSVNEARWVEHAILWILCIHQRGEGARHVALPLGQIATHLLGPVRILACGDPIVILDDHFVSLRFNNESVRGDVWERVVCKRARVRSIAQRTPAVLVNEAVPELKVLRPCLQQP